MKHVFRTSVLAASLAVAGCAHVTLVDPGKPAVMGDITVMPQIKWSQFPGDPKMWTVNGANLDSLHFFTGIRTGQPLFVPFGVPKNQVATYDAKMLPNDIQDLLVGTLQKQGYQNVRPGDLSPCPFGGTTGFCFDLSFATSDGLEMKGLVLADKRDASLDMVEFLAPAEYYFGEYSPTVSKLFASVQTNSGPVKRN